MLCDKLGWNIENIINIEDKINNIYITNGHFTIIFSTKLFRFPQKIQDFYQFNTREDLLIALRFTGFLSYPEFLEGSYDYYKDDDDSNEDEYDYLTCDICFSILNSHKKFEFYFEKFRICSNCLYSETKIKTWSLKDNIDTIKGYRKVKFVRLIPHNNKLIYFYANCIKLFNYKGFIKSIHDKFSSGYCNGCSDYYNNPNDIHVNKGNFYCHNCYIYSWSVFYQKKWIKYHYFVYYNEILNMDIIRVIRDEFYKLI